jgi:hypothetical protein
VHVAAPSAAAARDDRAGARGAEVGEEVARLRVVDERPRRHAQHEVLAAGPVLVLAAPVLAAAGAQVLGIR